MFCLSSTQESLFPHQIKEFGVIQKWQTCFYHGMEDTLIVYQDAYIGNTLSSPDIIEIPGVMAKGAAELTLLLNDINGDGLHDIALIAAVGAAGGKAGFNAAMKIYVSTPEFVDNRYREINLLKEKPNVRIGHPKPSATPLQKDVPRESPPQSNKRQPKKD